MFLLAYKTGSENIEIRFARLNDAIEAAREVMKLEYKARVSSEEDPESFYLVSRRPKQQ